MTTVTLHEPPRLSAVARQQVQTVARGMRREVIMYLTVLVGLFVMNVSLAIRGVRADVGPIEYSLSVFGELTIPAVLFAVVVAGGTWQREEPSRRGYHLSMPVPSRTHTWIRVGAGWLWLIVGTAAYIAMLLVIGLAETRVTGGSFQFQFSHWGWIAPFVAATEAYLIVTVPMVSSERPLAWVFVTPLMAWVLVELLSAYPWTEGRVLAQRWIASPFSPFMIVWPWANDIMGNGKVTEIDLGHTLLGVGFWIALAVVGITLGARRRSVSR